MMVSTSRLGDATVRTDAPASRRSISSQAASASRALSSVASTSVPSPYPGLLSSSSSSSSSLSTPKRRSLAAARTNSFSRYSVSSSSSGSLVNKSSAQPTRPSTTTTPSRNRSHKQNLSIATNCSSAHANANDAAHAPKRSPRHQRHHSAESLRLDLDGLDLGGNQDHIAPFDSALAQRHVRSRSNNPTQPPLAGFQHPFVAAVDKPVDVISDRFCTSCAHGLEDSFSAHLRAECSDYHEIMSSQVVLSAAFDKEHRMRSNSLESVDAQHPRACSIGHGQVLGGFASLGLQTETGVKTPAPERQQPLRSLTERSTHSSESPSTQIEWRDSFGMLATPTYAPTPKWAHLTGRPCNPLEPLDVLSIQEMGLHSVDIGSLNDWEGCKLSAEILCPINGHQRIEWSVAQTTRRKKKWVVVPNATVTCGTTEALSSAAQAERTVIVSDRSLWLDDAQSRPELLTSAPHSPQEQATMASTAQSSQRSPLPNRSSMPFSGKAGFELRLLRPTLGRICPPIYLANASTHRYLHQYRKHNRPLSSQYHGGLIAEHVVCHSANDSHPVSPVLRRTRSRPYKRHSHMPLRRSHSKPSLSQFAQQQAASDASPRINPEEFAPSLPGDPLMRTQPGESWPSARSRHADSLSSFDSNSSSDGDSDTSSDGAGVSATNTRESIVGSVSSASYDQPHQKHSEPTTGAAQRGSSAAIPIAVAGAHSGRSPRSLSPGSCASQGISSISEVSAAQSYRQQSSGSATYEADSWQGTSPTTASASSLSTSSKKSRSRGFQKALQKKDKMLSSWFKRRPDATAAAAAAAAAATLVSPATEREMVPGASKQWMGGVAQQNQASTNSSIRSSLARDSQDGSVTGAIVGSTPLTETALESFQRAMFRPASPESTIMGSRRGSEALTQKTIEPHAPVVEASQERTGGAANRNGVNSTLSQVYGWDRDLTAAKLARPLGGVRSGIGCSAPGSSLKDLDEENALVGLDAVPAEALTMLIPLPLIGRTRARDAVRYMRVNFVPFGSFADAFEATPGVGPAGLLNAASPGSESDSGLSQSLSTGSGGFALNREAVGSTTSSTTKSSEPSGWKRKLGLSSGRGGGGNSVQATNGANGQPMQGLRQEPNGHDIPQPQTLATSKPQAFRITAVVHDAPWTSSASCELDPRLPEPGTFPVVLGYCNGTKALEMVPEGWGALRLAGVPVPTKPDGSPLDGIHPLHGVSDLIIAAFAAVMDD